VCGWGLHIGFRTGPLKSQERPCRRHANTGCNALVTGAGDDAGASGWRRPRVLFCLITHKLWSVVAAAATATTGGRRLDPRKKAMLGLAKVSGGRDPNR
jgi:hypothetical protein